MGLSKSKWKSWAASESGLFDFAEIAKGAEKMSDYTKCPQGGGLWAQGGAEIFN